MPLQPIIPIWGGLNNANSASSTGLIDPVTGQQYNTGGLQLGDYFDLTESQANSLSVTATGTCHAGRYRWVQVDSNATAANVATGKVGYARQGSTVTSVQVLTQGSGQTVGTYVVQATAGTSGGVGATIQVVVSSATSITATVLNGGSGYQAPPTFTLATGGTPGTVVAQLTPTVNVVTSADIALSASGPVGIGAVRPVVFLNAITPGNYGFVQELGVATVLSKASVAQTVNQFATVLQSSPDGTLQASSATYGVYSIGNVLDPLNDTQTAATLFKVLLDGPVVQD